MSIICYNSCPICHSDQISLSLKAKDYTVSEESFEIWECSNCSVRFTQNIPIAQKIGAYYQSEEYISHSNTNKGLVNSLYQIVRKITLRQKKRLIVKSSGKKQGSILDIGCGTGEFLATMKSAGWDTTGLEPDEGARLQAQQKGLAVEPSERLFDLASEQFDVITMWHVLEHVHQLHEYLDTIHRLLKKDGKLLIAVPNYLSKDATHYGEHWAAYDVPRHLYHFTPEAMKVLQASHGLHIFSVKALTFDGFYVSILSEKYKNRKVRILDGFLHGFSSWAQSLTKPGLSSAVLYISSHSERTV